MKIGNMEVNALRANGVAACFEEKFFEDGDRQEDALPKSVNLVREDAKFYKCHIEFETTPAIQRKRKAETRPVAKKYKES